jgi:hypothetical protein
MEILGKRTLLELINKKTLSKLVDNFELPVRANAGQLALVQPLISKRFIRPGSHISSELSTAEPKLPRAGVSLDTWNLGAHFGPLKTDPQNSTLKYL